MQAMKLSALPTPLPPLPPALPTPPPQDQIILISMLFPYCCPFHRYLRFLHVHQKEVIHEQHIQPKRRHML